MKTVGIIGGAGFIGSFITRTFLENGFKVKVSALDISNKEKYAHLSGLPHAENLELAPLDVQNTAQLEAFAAGCDILVHSGTPFQLDVEDPQRDLFDPTINGTENVLQVAGKSATVKKVVFVASVAAFNTGFPLLPEDKGDDFVFTEEHPPIFHESHIPYARAKYFADQAVRGFIANNPAPGFEITTVSPVGVMGNALSAREDSTSMGVQFLFKNNIAPNPFLKMLFERDVLWALVDVVDVAEAVYQTATTLGLHGKNYLLSSESWRISDITRMLNGQAPVHGSRIVYSSAAAMRDLGVQFKSARVPLGNYAEAVEGVIAG